MPPLSSSQKGQNCSSLGRLELHIVNEVSLEIRVSLDSPNLPFIWSRILSPTSLHKVFHLNSEDKNSPDCSLFKQLPILRPNELFIYLLDHQNSLANNSWLPCVERPLFYIVIIHNCLVLPSLELVPFIQIMDVLVPLNLLSLDGIFFSIHLLHLAFDRLVNVLLVLYFIPVKDCLNMFTNHSIFLPGVWDDLLFPVFIIPNFPIVYISVALMLAIEFLNKLIYFSTCGSKYSFKSNIHTRLTD
jgi:hypothetical protein